MLFLPALDITEIQFFELFRKSCENNHTRGVGTGNRGGDKFSENTKSALSGGKVPCAFVKMFVQIAFFMILQLFVLQKTQKMSSLRWQAPFAFVKNVVQIAFYMIAIIFPLPPPPPVANISVKKISGACPFHSKMPLETALPPNLLMLLCP